MQHFLGRQGNFTLGMLGLLRSLKIAMPAYVGLRRWSVALLQNLPKTRAKSGRARLAYAPRAFFQIFIKATLHRRFVGLVGTPLNPCFRCPVKQTKAQKYRCRLSPHHCNGSGSSVQTLPIQPRTSLNSPATCFVTPQSPKSILEKPKMGII